MRETVFVLDSDPAELRPLRDHLKQFLERAGFSEKPRHDILVAVGEACTNAIRHAYDGQRGHKIEVTFQDFKEKVVLKVRDYGRKIDFSHVKTAPQLPPQKPGGLGSYFIKTMMDEVRYDTTHSVGNELILTKFREKGVSRENSS